MSSPPPKHSLSSPTSGNTPHPVLPTPSSSTSVSIRQNNKASQLKQELEQQLLEKQKQLRESSSGIGKNVLARQVSQLQERIKELDTAPSSSSTLNDQPSSVDRLRSLERDLSSYRSHPLSPGISSIRNKEKLLNQRSANGLDPLPSPSTSTLLPPTHGHDSTSLLPLPPPPTGSTPTKRRSKIPNTDRRNTDIEFATEIGQGLLLEVRKMQALLQEKEEKLRTLENQKADLERAAEAMAKQMRQREENEEKLKEETWNLELAKQELTISVTELQQNLSKANVEQNKLAKQVNELRSEIEQLRDREEKLTNTIDNMKQRHEQDMSSIRRHAAAIQREKTDQTKQIEALTSELAIAKAQSRISKHASTESEPSIRAGETTDDQAASTLAVKNDTSPSSSPPSSPKQSPARNQAMEVETLKTSLAHAHRMVSNLRSNLHKEKTEKFEFKKLLAESQETIEQLQNDPRMWVDAGPSRSTSGSASNIATREDGSTPGRRSHKALTASKRRGGRKGVSGRHKLRGASQNATADDDSVYSYSSMSDQEDSEDIDSFDDSDIGFGSDNTKKKAVGFTPLSSELSQVQMQKPVMVDAEINTDPIDDFLLPLPALEKSEPRSLGDELNMAKSQKEEIDDNSVPSIKNIAGGLVTGAAAVLGVESLLKSAGVEPSTQTDIEEVSVDAPGIEVSIQTIPLALEQQSLSSVILEPCDPIELELISKNTFSVEPEDPSIALASINAAIAAARLASLEAAIDSSTQSEPEDPSIALAATAAAISASRARALESAINSSTQCDDIVEDPIIAEAAEAAKAAAIAAGIAKGITDSRTAAIEAAIDTSVQYEEDPSIAEAEEAAKAAAIAAGIAAGLAKLKNEAREAAIDTSVQYEEDPTFAEAEEAAKATAIAAGIAAGIAQLKNEAREAAIDTSVQYEEDPSIVEAEEAAKATAIASGIAAGIAKLQSDAREAAIDTFVQHEEDPSIAEAEEAAKAAAIAAGIAAGIAQLKNEAREAAIDTSVQYEEDPFIAEAEEAAKAAAIASGIAAGIAKLQSDAREAAIDTFVQYEEDPSIAEAEEAAKAGAIAAGIAAGLAKLKNEAREAAIDTSVQYEEDPSIAENAKATTAAAIASGIAEGIIRSRSDALKSAIDSSVQSECEHPLIDDIALSTAISESRAASLKAAIDASVQYEEHDENIPVPVANAVTSTTTAAAAAAAAAAVIASRALTSEAPTSEYNSSISDQASQINHNGSDISNVQNVSIPADSTIIRSEFAGTTDTHSNQLVKDNSDFSPSTGNLLESNANSITYQNQTDVRSKVVGIQDEVESTYIGSPSENKIVHKDVAAVIAMPPSSTRTISDSEDEFFDAQSKPSSRRTINSFSNVKPDSRNSQLKEEVSLSYQKADADSHTNSNKHLPEHGSLDNDSTAGTASTLTGTARNGNIESHDFDHSINSGLQARQQDMNSKGLRSDISEKKMYSKSEADALIAAAVAAALANVVSSASHDHQDESKRHTCDMSNNYGADSAVVSPSPIKSATSIIDEDKRDSEDYGNVVVHLPREEDTITSLPFDHISERYRDRPVTASEEKPPTTFFENIKPSATETQEQMRPELTKGPTVVFDHEPEEHEISEADIPQRPSHPPPEALLSRASLSPAFTNNRPMSPSSNRSKGKAPLEFSDLESSPAPSHEDLQRAALLQQQQFNNKRGSISASSISTNNTTEQLQSIHSSQNDAVTRTSAATDPAMINLITQTMIGDWMYKYTRKTVGGGLSENRHQRYFWIHPYTRTLYWSTNAPGVDGNEAKAKSALIENITSVPDYSNSVDGTPNVSLLIQTSNRPLKLTAPTLEKHELWFEAISHLLARNRNSKGLTLLNDTKKPDNTNARSVSSGTTGSLLNRPSFRRLHDIFQQPSSSTSMATSDDHIELDDDDEALEDVRMCCNGKHHVSKLEKDHTHRHQYRKRKSRPVVTTIG